MASAKAGDGGDQTLIRGGDAGTVTVAGGKGGDGGDGRPAGAGGTGGDMNLQPGEPGTGSPPGEPGEETLAESSGGDPGETCGQQEGLLVALNERGYAHDFIKLLLDFWPISAVVPQQEGAIELGGGSHSVYPLMGQTIALTEDASRLFVSTEGAVFVYDNPLEGGERGPDVRLTPSGEPDDNYYPDGIYYDHVQDILYVKDGGYHAWHDASTIDANREADRTLLPNNVGLPGDAITGDPEADRLFIPGGDRVLVIDDASGAPSDTGFDADRTIEVDIDEQRMGRGIAYDATRDRLYTGTAEPGLHGDDCQLVVIDGASTPDPVEPQVLTDLSHSTQPPATLQVVPEGDALLVGFWSGDMAMFRNARLLESGPAPQPDETFDLNLNTMGAVYISP